MKFHLLIFSVSLLPCLLMAQAVTRSGLPDFTALQIPRNNDWLVQSIETPTQVYRDGGKDILLTNGLLLRRWRIEPEVATTHVTLLTTGENFVRGVKPEAQLVLDGDTLLVGGLRG